MKLPASAALAAVLSVGGVAAAADATSPVDAAQRNAAFAPAASVAPAKQAPAEQANSRLQDRRFETSTVERKMAPASGQRAAIDLQEARDKQVREKDSQRPEAKEQPVSRFNHRESAISTGSATTRPPTVAKYQDGLTAASAANMARFPALDQATSAKINRFVFRKNPPESAVAPGGEKVTPVAGGSAIRN